MRPDPHTNYQFDVESLNGWLASYKLTARDVMRAFAAGLPLRAPGSEQDLMPLVVQAQLIVVSEQ